MKVRKVSKFFLFHATFSEIFIFKRICKFKMMKTKILILSIFLFSLIFCTENDDKLVQVTPSNKVLILKVDYNTNVFEAGKELSFSENAANMSVTTDYVAPGDFGSLKLTYDEINETLFDGTIVWNGLGQMNYPQNLLQADEFEIVTTNDFVFPGSGFENVFNPDNVIYDYNVSWSAIQSLVKVREYLYSNPNATVKIFLYTPSVGVGNPAEWDWIFMLKN